MLAGARRMTWPMPAPSSSSPGGRRPSCILCENKNLTIFPGSAPAVALRTARDWAMLFALAAFWGSNFTFVKIGVSAVPPATLVAARLVIGAVILIAVVRVL